MAGYSDAPIFTLPLGKGHTQTMSPTQWQAILLGGISVPAISKHLKAFLYGWLPLSNAYGIFSLRPHNQSVYMSTLLPIPNLSTFPIAKYTAYQYFLLQFIPNLSAFFSMQPHSRYFDIPRCRKTIWCLHLSCNNTIFALKHLIYGKHLYPNLLTHHFRRS